MISLPVLQLAERLYDNVSPVTSQSSVYEGASCALAGCLVGIFALLVHLVARSAKEEEDEEPHEKSHLSDSDGRTISESKDPYLAQVVAVVGSTVLMVFGSVFWCACGRCGPLAVFAVGVSLLFTLRPASLKFRDVFEFNLNMATVPWIMVVWLLAVRAMPARIFWEGIVGVPGHEIVPWTMLLSFLCAVYLCTSLEVSGGLHKVAGLLARTWGESPLGLFCGLGVIAGVLTWFMPDDVVTMTLAPTVCELCPLLGLDPRPFLYVIFYNANIWAVSFITGNVTNMAVALITRDRFVSFLNMMALPGLSVSVLAFGLLYFTFKRSLRKGPAEYPTTAAAGLLRHGDSERGHGTMTDSSLVTDSCLAVSLYKRRATLCFARIIFTFTFAALDNFHHWPIWQTMAVFAGSSLVLDALCDVGNVDGTRTFTLDVLRSFPYGIVFFYLALFVLVEQLNHAGVVMLLANALEPLAGSPVAATFVVGFVALYLAQAVSAVPMTVLLIYVVTEVPSWRNAAVGTDFHKARQLALYTLVITSNFCANVSRMGAMGGQLLFRIARNHGVILSDAEFCWRGFWIMTPVTALCFVVLLATYELIH